MQYQFVDEMHLLVGPNQPLTRKTPVIEPARDVETWSEHLLRVGGIALMGENEPSPLGMFSPLYDDPVWRAWYMLEGTADRRDDY